METLAGFEARVCGLGAAHGRGELRKPKAKSACRRSIVHELEVTPGWGITDLFPVAAGLDLAKERGFLPCWQGGKLDLGQVSAPASVSPARRGERSSSSSYRGLEEPNTAPDSCRSLLRAPAADGKGMKSIQSRSREAETLKSP